MTEFDVHQRNYQMLLAFFGLWLGSMLLLQFVINPCIIALLYSFDSVRDLWDGVIPELTNNESRVLSTIHLATKFLVPPIFLSIIYKERFQQMVGSFSRPPSTLLLLGFSAVILSLPFIYMSFEVNKGLPLPDDVWKMQNEANEATTVLFNEMEAIPILLNILLIAIVAPVAEEIFFRGTFQRLILRLTDNPHLAIILAAFAFSVVHMQFAGFIPRMILGMMFGYMAWWSGNILVPIFCHAIYNGGQLALVYLWRLEIIADPELVSIPFYLSLFSVVTTTLILKQFYTRTIIKPETPI